MIPTIACIAYALPAAARSVRELATAGLLESDPAVLERFGFETVRIAVEESPYELAVRAAAGLLGERGIDPAGIGLLIWGGARGPEAFTPAAEPAPHASAGATARFKYPATRLQWELGLEHASVLALDQAACASIFAAVRVARGLCLAEGIERVLCVVSDFHPLDAAREQVLNCVSDAACAVLVDGTGERNRIVAGTHVTRGYCWDHDALRDEVVASYFPTAAHVLRETLRLAGWRPEEVDWVVPHNVSRRSWEILLGLVQLPRARLWDRNIPRVGHTLAGDNFLNLRDAVDGGEVRAGERLLLFGYGFGAHWAALAVEA